MSEIKNIFDMKTVMIIIVTVLVHLGIAMVFIMMNRSAREQQLQTISSLQSQWSFDDTQRQKAEEEELGSKYGTTKMDRIAYDPRLDIKLVLEKLCKAAMPPEYLITVTVDRFTEFKIHVNTFNLPHPEVLAAQLKEVFSEIDTKYVYQVIFTDGDRFHIVDTTQLEKIRDWKTASISTIQRYCF